MRSADSARRESGLPHVGAGRGCRSGLLLRLDGLLRRRLLLGGDLLAEEH